MLVLAVHTVNTVTAKVAFGIIMLQDHITNKKVPAEFKCRQLIPTSGSKSVSLWDVDDPEALLVWLAENINVDCAHEVFEVQEDFGTGLGEVTRARAADRVTSGTKDVGKAIGAAGAAAVHSVQDIDNKLRISERATHAVEAVRDSAVVQGTAAALTKAGSSVKTATTKVLDQPAVASATEAVGTSFRKLGASLSTLSSKVIPQKKEAEVQDEFDEPPRRADPPPPPPAAGLP